MNGRDPLFDFTGEVALITGGSSGLGREMALALAARGADVIIASRKLDRCEVVAAEARAHGVRALAVAAHVGRWAECDALIDAAIAAFGRITILINNAGMSPASPSHEVSEDLFDTVVNLNFKGPFRLASRAAHHMTEGDGGSIINVASSGALMPLPHVVPYAAAKAAQISMSESLAHEYGPKVRVNTLVPGPFLTRQAQGRGDVDGPIARNARGFSANSPDIVTAALFLASPASANVTAAVVRCDGGQR
jgi:NAD(P)-dependent dehydrogenase (short-subunit alcohol dehydrogenase family)